MNEVDLRNQLRAWIVERAALDGSFELEDEQQIIGEGLLSSLDVVELVLFIEHLRGEEIDLDLLRPESFESINALYKSFFSSAIAG